MLYFSDGTPSVDRPSKANETFAGSSYSESYLGDFWISASGLDVSWNTIGSAAEMETRDPPNPVELSLTFNKDFGDLDEIAPYTLADVVRTSALPYEGPMNICGRAIG